METNVGTEAIVGEVNELKVDPVTGEENCLMYGNCSEFISEEKCNSFCGFYNPKDGKLPLPLIEEEKVKENLRIEVSRLPKFDKSKEFIVMKNHVFQMQSISPKKIILKFKRKLKKEGRIADGIYVFLNDKDEVLDPFVQFRKFDKGE